MRNYSKTIGALAAASTLVAGNASAQLEQANHLFNNVAGELHVGYANMYEFRFVDQGNDLVHAGVDLAYDAGLVNVTAGAWYGTWDTPAGAAANSEELDLYAGISYDVTEDLSLEAGHVTYTFFDGFGATTHEVYLSGTYQLPYNLALESTYSYDYEVNHGWYWDTNVSYTRELTECLSFNLTAGFAVADGYNLQASTSGVGTEDGLQGYYVGASLPWEFREGVTLTPYIKYTDAESGLVTNVSAPAKGGEEFIIAGVSLAVGF